MAARGHELGGWDSFALDLDLNGATNKLCTTHSQSSITIGFAARGDKRGLDITSVRISYKANVVPRHSATSKEGSDLALMGIGRHPRDKQGSCNLRNRCRRASVIEARGWETRGWAGMSGGGALATGVLRGQSARVGPVMRGLVAKTGGKAGVTGSGPGVGRRGSGGGLRRRVGEADLWRGEVAEAFLGVGGPVVRHGGRRAGFGLCDARGVARVGSGAEEGWRGLAGAMCSSAAAVGKGEGNRGRGRSRWQVMFGSALRRDAKRGAPGTCVYRVWRFFFQSFAPLARAPFFNASHAFPSHCPPRINVDTWQNFRS